MGSKGGRKGVVNHDPRVLWQAGRRTGRCRNDKSDRPDAHASWWLSNRCLWMSALAVSSCAFPAPAHPPSCLHPCVRAHQVVAANKEGRAQAAAEAEVLLREEMRAFEAWRDSLETVPTIKALRNKAENIRASEVSSSRGMGQ